MAPILYQVEESYRDQVNFVMVNGDDSANWFLVEKLGVDAIPHLALIEADGTVDTALIGPVPKEWLTKDLDVLIENAKNDATKDCVTTTTTTTKNSNDNDSSSTRLCATTDAPKKQPLPYQMLDGGTRHLKF